MSGEDGKKKGRNKEFYNFFIKNYKKTHTHTQFLTKSGRQLLLFLIFKDKNGIFVLILIKNSLTARDIYNYYKFQKSNCN